MVGLIDSIATADELTLCLVVWVLAGWGRVVHGGGAAKAGAVVLILLSSLTLLGAGHAS